jgi:hypothetical protein
MPAPMSGLQVNLSLGHGSLPNYDLIERSAFIGVFPKLS